MVDEITGLLDAGRDVALREALKRERRALERTAETEILARQERTDLDAFREFADLMAPVLERYLATSFPLIEHESPLWKGQVRALAELAGTNYFQGGLVSWIQMPRWLGWWLANACGGFALAVDNLRAVRTLLEANVDRYQETLGTLIPGEGGANVGQAVMRHLVPRTTYIFPFFEQLLRALAESDFLRERYPEFAGSSERAQTALNDFNFLATLYAGAHDEGIAGTWTIYDDGGLKLSERLRVSPVYRALVAEQVLGVPVEELETHGQQWLGHAYSQPGYHNSEARLWFGDR